MNGVDLAALDAALIPPRYRVETERTEDEAIYAGLVDFERDQWEFVFFIGRDPNDGLTVVGDHKGGTSWPRPTPRAGRRGHSVRAWRQDKFHPRRVVIPA